MSVDLLHILSSLVFIIMTINIFWFIFSRILLRRFLLFLNFSFILLTDYLIFRWLICISLFVFVHNFPLFFSTSFSTSFFLFYYLWASIWISFFFGCFALWTPFGLCIFAYRTIFSHHSFSPYSSMSYFFIFLIILFFWGFSSSSSSYSSSNS